MFAPGCIPLCYTDSPPDSTPFLIQFCSQQRVNHRVHLVFCLPQEPFYFWLYFGITNVFITKEIFIEKEKASKDMLGGIGNSL